MRKMPQNTIQGKRKKKHTLRVLLLFQASMEFCQLSVPPTLKVVTEEQG